MTRRRLVAVAVTLALCAAVVAARAVQVMVLGHARYERLARRQQRRVLTVPSRRGEIRSADGYLMAATVDRVAVQADSRVLAYPALFARAAAPLLGVDAERLAGRLTSSDRTLWLAQRVSRETGEAVRRLAPSAVVLVPDGRRVYPLHGVAAPVIGFTGREELRTVGRTGLEQHYDTLLAGEPARYLAVRDAVQRQLRLRRLRGGRTGYSVELTLNARLQAACERELLETIERTGAAAASAVVLDPATGNLLALASEPAFDPAAPAAVPREQWRLHPVQDALEPGSTVKPLLAAAALACSAVRPGERLDCRARGTTVAGHWIRDHAEPGRYTLAEIIAHSSNAGAVEVAGRIDRGLLWRTYDAFGVGRRTGIGFPGEAKGVLRPVASWTRMSPAGVALGQEITVSPLQLALAYAVPANGGWLPQPNLVRSAGGAEQVAHGGPRWRRHVLSADLAARVSSMLELVVTEGTGKEAAVAGFRVAGKTGTAQRAVDGRFDDRHHVAWFAGFLPLPRPRAVIVVAIEEPTGDYWATSVAAPCFRRIAEAVVRTLEIPPAEAPRMSVARADRPRREAVS